MKHVVIFDSRIANEEMAVGGVSKKVGIEKAVIINLIYGWLMHNSLSGQNVIDGSAWTYITAKSMSEQTGCLSENAVRKHINELVESGILKKGNFNRTAFDRTHWYAFGDNGLAMLRRHGISLDSYGKYQSGEKATSKSPKGEMEVAERRDGSGGKATPIPTIETTIYTTIEKENILKEKEVVRQAYEDNPTESCSETIPQDIENDNVNLSACGGEPHGIGGDGANETKRVKRKSYGAYGNVKLSDEEYSKIVEMTVNDPVLRGVPDAADFAISKFDETIEMKGYKYKNYYLAFRNWGFESARKAALSRADDTQLGEELSFEDRRMIARGYRKVEGRWVQ